MRVEPDHREAATAPSREAADRPDVRAATAAEHERTGREVANLGCHLILERRLVDHGSLRIRKREMGRLRHRVAAYPPGARHAHEAGRVLAAAAVALVLVVDRDRRDRAAVGTTGAQRAHTVRSHVSERRTTCSPTRS